MFRAESIQGGPLSTNYPSNSPKNAQPTLYEPNNLFRLPNEILYRIIIFLENYPKDLVSFSMACRLFQDIVYSKKYLDLISPFQKIEEGKEYLKYNFLLENSIRYAYLIKKIRDDFEVISKWIFSGCEANTKKNFLVKLNLKYGESENAKKEELVILNFRRAFLKRDKTISRILYLDAIDLGGNLCLPLHWSICYGKAKFLKAFAQKYFTSDIPDAWGEEDLSKIIQFLTNQRPDILQQEDEHGATIAHYAAQAGYFDLVQFFIERDQDLIKKTDVDGCSMLDYAAVGGHCAIVEFLDQRNPHAINMRSGEELKYAMLMYAAAKKGHLDIIQFLFKKDKLTSHRLAEIALFHAMKNDNFNAVKVLAKICKFDPISERTHLETLVNARNSEKYQSVKLLLQIEDNKKNDYYDFEILKIAIQAKYQSIFMPGNAMHAIFYRNIMSRELLALAIDANNHDVISTLAKDNNFNPLFCKEDFEILLRAKSKNKQSFNTLWEASRFPFGLAWLGKFLLHGMLLQSALRYRASAGHSAISSLFKSFTSFFLQGYRRR